MNKEPREISLIEDHGEDDASLADVLDHVLNMGVVIRGSIVISIAGVDLIYLGVDVVLTSIETALRHIPQVAASGIERASDRITGK